MIEGKNIPELRFPGFTGEWEEKKLGEVNTVNKINKLPESFYYIDLESVNQGIVDKNLAYYKLDYAPSRAKRLLKKDDILYSTVRPYQNNNLYIDFELDKPMVASTGFALLRTKIDSKFQYYYLYNYNFTVEVLKRCTGTSYPAISSSELSEIEIKKPSLPEQQKIGSFFYTIDQKLDLQKKRIEELKTYKKGMMQRIFSQEIRFKDENGQDYPDWEEKRLGEILKEKKEMLQKGEGVPHASLTKNGIELKTERYDRDFLVRTKDKKYKVSKLGDICYNPANLKFGVITINTIGTVIFSPIYVTFVVNKNISERYLSYYLMRWDFINKVRKFEEGTVYERMAVKPIDFLKYKINLPSLPEQEKIASFLSAIDKKIELEEERLEAYEEFKKGLMQRMFV